jgi:GTP-binding protein HflX
VPYPAISLVGYTNAGKSTLFNALTGASVLAEDTLFATLDPTHRAIQLPHGSKAMLSDTVGFISDLPTMLIAAFRATLEEVVEADLILRVRDIADAASAQQRADVNAILSELGVDAEAKPQRLLEVWNKSDRLDVATLARLRDDAARDPTHPCVVSAVTGDGLKQLLTKIEARLNRARDTLDLTLQPDEGALENWIYENCEVIARSDFGDGVIRLCLRVAPEKRHRLARLAGPTRLGIAAE